MNGLKKIAVIIILAMASGCTSFFFFYPEKGLRNNPNLERFPPEDVYFRASDGTRLHGWFFRAEGESHGTILFLHGNAENISTHINSVLWLVVQGFDIFAFDYRGYGLSEGETTLDGVHIDAQAALEAVVNNPNAHRQNIFILGQSVGGAIAVYTLANFPYKDSVKGLILDSAFSDYRRIAREKLSQIIITWPLQYPFSYLFNNRYSPEKWIKKVYPVPVLIIHGDSDNIIPVHHSSILFKEAPGPKEFLVAKGAGHVWAFGDPDIRDRLVRFLKGN